MKMAEYVEGLVSVIIPTYKRSDLLKRAIDTTLNQTYKNLELLVVNDNIPGDEYSLDLYRLIDSYDDHRLKLVEQEKHINGAAARNAGIREAKGEYIAFQDDDDYWEMTKLERQVNKFKTLDETWGAVSCLMKFYKNGRLIRSCLPYKDGNILFDILTLKTGLGTGAVLIRRSALDDVVYFDENLMRHQDLQLFARLTDQYKVKLLKQYLHNRETKDNQNRPNAEKLDGIKQAYFNSIDDILKRLPPRKRKQVFIMHRFDTANTFMKCGKSREFVLRTLGVAQTPLTIYLTVTKFGRRFVESRLRRYLEERYR
jgi:glycosyltransferase involved in cell wall biosynthesis